MAKQEILEFLSCDESTGEDMAMLDPVTSELTGSDTEVEDIVQRRISASKKATTKVFQDYAESDDESIGDEEEEEEQAETETSEEPSNKLENIEVEIVGGDITKRKREEGDEDGGKSGDDESSEGDARPALLDRAKPSNASPSVKKKRKSTTKSTAKEKPASAPNPPPSPRKSRAKKDARGTEIKEESADTEDTGTNDEPEEGSSGKEPPPKPKRGGKKKEADTNVVKAPAPAKPRGRPRKTAKKDPKVPNNENVPPQGQSKPGEGGITAGEIGIIFETLTAEADWAAIVAKTNSLIGLKRLGQNVSKHWKTVAKKRLLDAYGG